MRPSDVDQPSAPPLYPPTIEAPPRPLPLPRHFARFVRNPLRTVPIAVYEEPLVFHKPASRAMVWVTDPALIEKILLSEHESFPKTPLERLVLAPILGEGLLTAEGEPWRWQRKIAAPLFRHAEILRYVPAMRRAGEAQLARWRASPQRVHAIDRDMTETTFAVITQTILAGCDKADGEAVMEAGIRFLESVSWPIAYATLGVPAWMWHPGKGRMGQATKELRSAVGRIVAKRRESGIASEDLLARMLASRHPETGASMSETQLVDNLTTFLAAGHETTAKALTWTLYLLARAPDWQNRVRAEVRQIAGEDAIAATHIEKFATIRRVLEESLRLYPPAPVLTRVSRGEARLAGRQIGAGTLIIIPIFAVHRHRRLWADPDRFDPDRFAPERRAAYVRTQFIPFGFGPRTCIGASFAMVEATAILATLVRGARFEWDGKHCPEPISRVTLKPKGGMPLGVAMA
jgi:cytochrome P450